MRSSPSLSCISATISYFEVPLAVHPSPPSRVYNSKKGGEGSSDPVRDTDYTCSVEFQVPAVRRSHRRHRGRHRTRPGLLPRRAGLLHSP